MPRTKDKINLIIDAGNGNVKVGIGDEFSIIPSVFRWDDGNRVSGGFKLNGKDCIVGWDNDRRDDVIKVINDDRGKLRYLDLLVAGALSSLVHTLPRKTAAIDVYLLTLNNLKRETVQDKLDNLKNLEIHGAKYNLTLKLKEMLPEGYGAALYGAYTFPDKDSIGVADIGNGTLNLAQYTTKPTFPAREMFMFQPQGFASIVKFVANEYRKTTTSGLVNEVYIRQALNHNTYLYDATAFDEVDIKPYAEKAVDHWMSQPSVQEMLIKMKDMLAWGIPIVACGGGFESHLIQDKFRQVLKGNELFHIPPNPVAIGVQGVQKELLARKEKSNEQAA